MHFTQAMISLVQEIRRRAPAASKARIKFTNDNLPVELIPLYQNSHDVIIRTLIKELFELGGDDWHAWQLDNTDVHAGAGGNAQYVTRTYRGQAHRVAVQLQDSEAAQSAKPKAQRIYRGQVVK